MRPCRVYLVGGGSAQGSPEDTLVVYTPSVLDDGIYMSNVSLPYPMFWSDVIANPGALLSYISAWRAEMRPWSLCDTSMSP